MGADEYGREEKGVKINDFVIRFANVNDTRSASANALGK